MAEGEERPPCLDEIAVLDASAIDPDPTHERPVLRSRVDDDPPLRLERDARVLGRHPPSRDVNDEATAPVHGLARARALGTASDDDFVDARERVARAPRRRPVGLQHDEEMRLQRGKASAHACAALLERFCGVGGVFRSSTMYPQPFVLLEAVSSAS
jgi:hypothetical protein